jgi:hypothetical protein
MKQLSATITALESMPAPEGPPLAAPVREELMTSFRSIKTMAMDPDAPPPEAEPSG